MAVNSNLRISSLDLTARFLMIAIMPSNFSLYLTFFMLSASISLHTQRLSSTPEQAGLKQIRNVIISNVSLFSILEYFIILLTSHAPDLLKLIYT